MLSCMIVTIRMVDEENAPLSKIAGTLHVVSTRWRRNVSSFRYFYLNEKASPDAVDGR